MGLSLRAPRTVIVGETIRASLLLAILAALTVGAAYSKHILTEWGWTHAAAGVQGLMGLAIVVTAAKTLDSLDDLLLSTLLYRDKVLPLLASILGLSWILFAAIVPWATESMFFIGVVMAGGFLFFLWKT